MCRITFKFYFLILAGASLIFSCAARADGKDASATIENDQQIYVVNPNGTWTMTRELSIRLNNARAIALAQQPFQYNATLETRSHRHPFRTSSQFGFTSCSSEQKYCAGRPIWTFASTANSTSASLTQLPSFGVYWNSNFFGEAHASSGANS